MNSETKYLLGGLVGILMVIAVGAMNVRCNTDRTAAVVNGALDVLPSPLPVNKTEQVEPAADPVVRAPAAAAPVKTLDVSISRLCSLFERSQSGGYRFKSRRDADGELIVRGESTTRPTVLEFTDVNGAAGRVELICTHSDQPAERMAVADTITAVVRELFFDPSVPTKAIGKILTTPGVARDQFAAEERSVTIVRSAELEMTVIVIEPIGLAE